MCEMSKTVYEEMGFVKERRTYTKRLATKIVEEVLADDLSNQEPTNLPAH